MKNLFLALFAALISLTLIVPDAEARRMGGGRSSGMQRQATPPAAAPNKSMAAPAAAPQAQPKRSWMGPIAGLAAGLGLAALASHLGIGAEVANFLMIALLILVAFMVIRWLMRRAPQSAAHPGMQYAANGPQRFEPTTQPSPQPAAGEPNLSASSALPAGFDQDAFLRLAKITFIRMQAAHDAGNLNDLRSFLSPEMFAEVKLDVDARAGATNQTDVQNLQAELFDYADAGQRLIVSVRFSGQLREDGVEAPFDEVWHLTRNAGQDNWVVAGIQQL